MTMKKPVVDMADGTHCDGCVEICPEVFSKLIWTDRSRRPGNLPWRWGQRSHYVLSGKLYILGWTAMKTEPRPD